MGWFTKDPPKPLIPGWLKISVPIIVLVIASLLSIVYTGMAEEIKSKADKETTLKAIETNQKTLEKHQETLDKTLKIIIEMQTERKLQQRIQQEQPVTREVVPQQTVEKPPLSPKEFQEYLNLSKSDKEAFRKLHPSYGTLPK